MRTLGARTTRAHTASRACAAAASSVSGQELVTQDRAASTKAGLEQRHCSSPALQEPGSVE